MMRIYTLIISLCMACSIYAQQARDYFTSMPDSVLPLLTAVNRADCIDFLDSHMRAEVTNRFNSKSEMTQLTLDFIEMKLSASATWQMKVLPWGTAQVVCTISTVSAPAADSHFQFFDDDWKPLPQSRFIDELPVLEDFFIEIPDTVNVNRYQFYRNRVNMLLMQASLSPDAQTLTFKFTTPSTLDEETLTFLKPYIREEVVYRWKEGKFIR